jgi:hypothetical protein
MRTHWVGLLSFLFLLSGIGYQFLRIDAADRKEAPLTDSEESNIEFISLSGQKVSLASFENGTPLVLYYFDPNCDFCTDMTRKILDNFSEFNTVELDYVDKRA